MRLKNRCAIVTGAGSGIGKAIAKKFSDEGAKVVIADINRDRGAQTAAEIERGKGDALFIQTDVTKANQIEHAVENASSSFGKIDILVNNAGASCTEDLLDVSEDDWDRDVDVNLKSFYLWCKVVVPIMINQGGGTIVNISSVNGLMAVGEIGYSAAKAGVINLTKNIAVRHGPDGIRCNAICPGTIETETVARYWDEKAGGRYKLKKWYPLRRLGKPEEIAAAALFLASDEASFITGATLVVDGGLTAGWTYFGHEIVTGDA